MSDDSRPPFVLAITLECEATEKQRMRNFAFYQRLKDGDPTARGGGVGLSEFMYEAPIERLRVAPNGKTFSFRLDRGDECFMRLLSVIVDHCDTKCDADDEVDRLRSEIAQLRSTP